MAKTSSKKRNLKKPAKTPARTATRQSAPPAPKKIQLTQKSVAGPVRRSAKTADVKPTRPPVVTTFIKKPSAPPQKLPPPMILPPSIPTDGKPRKNQAGFLTKDLEYFRSLLLAKRRELVGDMSSMEREALRSASGSNLSNLPIHMADMGTDNYEQEFTLGLVEKDRQLLREINSALAKIQNGTFGICEGTGKPITRARLEAQPWAKYSIEYARELEKGGVRR